MADTLAPTRRRAGRLPVFIGRRLVRLLVSVYVLVTATFLMVRLVPGDPVIASLGDQATPELVERLRRELGLDQPLLVQYLTYFKNVFSGDLGTSIISHDPVSTLLWSRIPNTIGLALPAFFVVILLGIPLGYLMALKTRGGRNERLRSAFIGGTGVLNSVPEFVMAVGLSAAFALTLNLFPVAGKAGPLSYVLPVAALVIGPAATLSRIVRVEALKVLDADYVLAARSRRLSRAVVYGRHVLPNMLTASLTYGGLLLSHLIAGTVLVENVFGWPGLGTSIAEAVVQKDYPVIQGILLVLGAAVLVVTMAVDVLLGLLDPRSRVTEG